MLYSREQRVWLGTRLGQCSLGQGVKVDFGVGQGVKAKNWGSRILTPVAGGSIKVAGHPPKAEKLILATNFKIQ